MNSRRFSATPTNGFTRFYDRTVFRSALETSAHSAIGRHFRAAFQSSAASSKHAVKRPFRCTKILEKYLLAVFERYRIVRIFLRFTPNSTKNARPPSPTGCAASWKRTLKLKASVMSGRKHGVNVKGIHSLRHTFCTIAGVVGIPEPVVRSIVVT